MAHKYNKINVFKEKRRYIFDVGLAKHLPAEYKKFWHEWKYQKPVPVHWIEKPGRFERREDTGEVFPVQNVPFPMLFPREMHQGIWGGECVIQGFVKKSKWDRRIPKFWVPNLKRSIVYSEVLDTYMRTIVTNRTVHLIHEHYGFDHYLLKTPACDLRSLLALSIKRNILIALADKTLYPNDPVKREEIYEKYKQYLDAYTREEIEWYGLDLKAAIYKLSQARLAEKKVIPLKMTYRSELIASLKAAKIKEAMNVEMPDSNSTWISKINPFGKSPKAE